GRAASQSALPGVALETTSTGADAAFAGLAEPTAASLEASIPFARRSRGQPVSVTATAIASVEKEVPGEPREERTRCMFEQPRPLRASRDNDNAGGGAATVAHEDATDCLASADTISFVCIPTAALPRCVAAPCHCSCALVSPGCPAA